MIAVILAGGLGTRLSEETHLVPKPMVTIGDRPIIWHIMKIYQAHGINEFVICLGYKGYVVKEFFANYSLHNSDVTIEVQSGSVTYHAKRAEEWKVTLIDTGQETMTGGRLGRIKNYVDGTFLATYGDGLSDVSVKDLVAHHRSAGKLATLTAVTPPGRYGAIVQDGTGNIEAFAEKPPGDGAKINGGFFVLEPEVFDYINGDSCIFEEAVLPSLANNGELSAFNHEGFWQPMDTLRDRRQLEEMWASGNAPWKIWE
jgi:glucose-1-phosphate cytidylyltransferase